MYIYLVILIIQLESISKDNNSYRQNTDADSSSILNKNYNDISFYEIEHMINRQILRKKRQYLVK